MQDATPAGTTIPAQDAAAARPVTKRCPRCAEEVRSEALVCRYCSHELEAGRSTGLTTWLRAQTTLLVPFAAFLYAVLQVYKIGEYENQVELIRSAGLTTILVGVLLVQLPMGMVLLWVGCCWWLINAARTWASGSAARAERGSSSMRSSNDPRKLPALLLAPLLALSFYLSPWPLFLLSVVLAAGTLLAVYRPRGSSTERRRRIGWVWRKVLGAVGLIFLGVLVDRPAIWVPVEAIQTTDHGAFAAYVIAENDNWVTILAPTYLNRPSPTGAPVFRELSANITARQPCAANIFEGATLSAVARYRPVQFFRYVVYGTVPTPLTQQCPPA